MLLAGVVPLLCPRCARRKLQEYSSRFSSLTCNEHRLTGLAVRCGSGPWSSAGPLPCSPAARQTRDGDRRRRKRSFVSFINGSAAFLSNAIRNPIKRK